MDKTASKRPTEEAAGEVRAKMDAALAEAEKELPGLKTAADVVLWLKKHYMSAGYKRLNRSLMAHFTKSGKQ